jgi:serine/threonine-protein kinase HipA
MTLLDRVDGQGADDGASYVELADLLIRLGSNTEADLEQLWRRIVFFICVSNTDDHLRNHGFLHAGRGLWRLAPAFDLNTFPDRARELKTWISPDTGPAATLEALQSVTPYFRLSPRRARTILRAVVAAVATWRKTGRKLGLTPTELDAFADAFEHPEMAAARKV